MGHCGVKRRAPNAERQTPNTERRAPNAERSSLHIHVPDQADQRWPTIVMPGQWRILHLADRADPLRSELDCKRGKARISRMHSDCADLPSNRFQALLEALWHWFDQDCAVQRTVFQRWAWIVNH
jgi:hypothetical protein